MKKLIWKILNPLIDISCKHDWKLLLFLFFPFWGKLQFSVINACCWLLIRITIKVSVNQTLPIEINIFSKMTLKWLNRLSSLLQHLFDFTAIKTAMIMMMILKVLMQCSSFYNMTHQNLHMYSNFIFAGWTVFNRKINKFEIINLQLSYLDKSVDQPESCLACFRPSVGKTGRNGKRRYSSEGGLERVGSLRTRPKTSLVFYFHSSATSARFSIALRFTGRTLGTG